MATEKKKLVVYISPENEESLDALYEIWRRKQVSRGVPGVASKSKFVEWILRRYVIAEGVRIVEEKRAMELRRVELEKVALSESKNAV
jgi:hypothetical protein